MNAYLRQSPHRHVPGGGKPPEGDEYIARCLSCRRCFCWPKTAITKGIEDRGFRCPVCAGWLHKTTRMAHGPWLHLYEHQAANLQARHPAGRRLRVDLRRRRRQPQAAAGQQFLDNA